METEGDFTQEALDEIKEALGYTIEGDCESGFWFELSDGTVLDEEPTSREVELFDALLTNTQEQIKHAKQCVMSSGGWMAETNQPN